MHILFLTDNFPPEVNAPATRTHEHCREWVKAGHQVTVITTAPNFPKGELFEGYRNKLWQSEVLDGVRVIRVWTYITANAGFFKRTLDYVSFMLAATAAAPFVSRVDLVVATSPQFFTALAGFMVGAIKRRPWVFELRDLWPESIKAVGAMKDGVALRALERLEMFLYRRASAIVSVTRSFRRRLIDRGVNPERISVVTNGVDLSRFAPRAPSPELAEELGLQGKFVAGYVGTHGMAHGLETLLEAAERLANDPDGRDIRVLMLGDGAEKRRLVETARTKKLDNVIFVDSVPRAQVADYWSLLDVAIIHLRKDDLFKTVIPSKLFESMAMGLPVAFGVEGESADIVRRESVGLTFEPGDAAALAAAIKRLAREPATVEAFKANALDAAKRYDRAALARAMLRDLGDVAARRPLTSATARLEAETA